MNDLVLQCGKVYILGIILDFLKKYCNDICRKDIAMTFEYFIPQLHSLFNNNNFASTLLDFLKYVNNHAIDVDLFEKFREECELDDQDCLIKIVKKIKHIETDKYIIKQYVEKYISCRKFVLKNLPKIINIIEENLQKELSILKEMFIV